MTCDEMLSALRRRRETLEGWPAEACAPEYDKPGMGKQMKHARWLLDQTIRAVEEDVATEGEASWCLGFVECVLWINGVRTMAEMKEEIS